MDAYKGKTVLVVNTASKCGLTPQFEGLEELNKKYKDKGLVILGFPCNQFAHQEPGDEKSIEEGCVINYGVTFQMYSKIDVNGEDAHPIYKFLKRKQGGVFGSAIKWNFTKFLIDSTGKPIKRFAPQLAPADFESDIAEALGVPYTATVTKAPAKNSLVQTIARILLGVAMMTAGIGHLTFQRQEFLAQVPHWIPLSADLVVLLSGAVEIGLGAGLLFFKRKRILVGALLALFYVLIFPGNYAQYANHVSAFGLDTDRARLIRLFFQPVLVLWALWSSGALNVWREKGIKALLK
jgi:glutathione peroxidase